MDLVLNVEDFDVESKFERCECGTDCQGWVPRCRIVSNCVQSEDILEKVDVNIQPESHQCGVRHLESSC